MLVDIGGLYNGKDIPKKGETWDTDKNNAVDLINKGWAEAMKSAPKKTASAKAGKEKANAKHYMGKKKKKSKSKKSRK